MRANLDTPHSTTGVTTNIMTRNEKCDYQAKFDNAILLWSANLAINTWLS